MIAYIHDLLLHKYMVDLCFSYSLLILEWAGRRRHAFLFYCRAPRGDGCEAKEEASASGRWAGRLPGLARRMDGWMVAWAGGGGGGARAWRVGLCCPAVFLSSVRCGEVRVNAGCFEIDLAHVFWSVPVLCLRLYVFF